MLNYFDQPHYSYVKKNLFWQVSVPLLPSSGKKKGVSVVGLHCTSAVNQNGFGAGEAGRGATPKPQAQVLYVGHHWLVPPCVFLTTVSCSDKCCDPTLCQVPCCWQQSRHLVRDLCLHRHEQMGENSATLCQKKLGFLYASASSRPLKVPNRNLHRNVGWCLPFREGSKLEPQNILSNVGSGKPCSSWAVIVNLALVSDDPSHHKYIASHAMAWFCEEVGV